MQNQGVFVLLLIYFQIFGFYRLSDYFYNKILYVIKNRFILFLGRGFFLWSCVYLSIVFVCLVINLLYFYDWVMGNFFFRQVNIIDYVLKWFERYFVFLRRYFLVFIYFMLLL